MLINQLHIITQILGAMDSEKYKLYHEAKMVNNNGSSVFEIEAVLTTVSFGVFFRLWLKYFTYLFENSFIIFVADFLLIAMPVTLEVTVVSGMPYLIPLNMALLFAGIILKDVNMSSLKVTLSKTMTNRKSYITNYRASTNLVSALCILAVDFAIFPRRYAKTESFGFALMDLGVGYFVCSNGIVTKSLLSNMDFFKIVKSCGVLILLGFIRLLSVKSTQYHEHASEYGVHWNFFFTLGFCRVVSYLILIISPVKNPLFLALLTGLLYETLLCFGVQEWVLGESSRDTLLSANREGLASLLGYISLYFASVAIGQFLNMNSGITYKTLLLKLTGLCIFMWASTSICNIIFGTSRRLANAGYNIWIVSSTLTVLLEFVVIDVVISSCDKSLKKEQMSLSQTPFLMESVNANGLFFFLFSNIMTGIINILFKTFLLDPLSSFGLIALYMTLLCGISCILYSKRWILKFW